MDNLTRHQRHYRKNREKILAKQKAKRQEPKEKARIQAYRDANKSRSKEYYEENKEVLLEKASARYAEKREECLKKRKDRYWKDVEETRRKASEYIRKRNLNDEAFRLLGNMRSRLRIAMRDQGTMKVETSLRLFGCSADELKAHIESQFTDGMSWENYGIHGWHVDHIKPCSSFDFSLDSEQRECFHYSNLHPLWAEDNLRKSNKN